MVSSRLRYMKKVHILLLSILCVTSLMAQNKRALLIGIGEYPAESGWTRIHGDNDVPLIEEKLLQSGFNQGNIMKLTNSEATCAAIKSSLGQLVATAAINDVIYVHFSGHGQQITDTNKDETQDHLDESWVPYDARKKYVAGIYEGENHIIDDYLNAVFTRIRSKIGSHGKLIIVADACHSGSGSRGEEGEDVFIRGTRDNFVIPTKDVNSTFVPDAVDWLFIAACKSYQTNFEYKAPDGNFYGALTYSISKEIKSLTTSTCEDILKVLDAKVNEKTKSSHKIPQNIDCDGKPSRYSEYMF